MRIVLQRVARGTVTIDGRIAGMIERGLVLLVGLATTDGEETLTWMADKVVGLRVFPDEEGRMNHSLDEVGGGLLVVSQFTLYGDARKGRRPSFAAAAPPDAAVSLYERFVDLLRERAPGRVETGEFGARMDLELVNSGPVTMILER
jgi:D-tyrosyl-tRNA(Tyr) deacylase